MRSRLEARFARWLDEWGVEWAYEPGLICGEGGRGVKGGCYLPDFLVDIPYVGARWIEVKPTSELGYGSRERMEKCLYDFPTVGLIIVVPSLVRRREFDALCEYDVELGCWTEGCGWFKCNLPGTM